MTRPKFSKQKTKQTTNNMGKRKVHVLTTAADLAFKADFKRANLIVDQILKDNPHDTKALLLKGAIAQASGECRKMILCAEKILKQDRNNISALNDAGDYYFYKGQYVRALKFYNRAAGLLRRGFYSLDRKSEIFDTWTGMVECFLNRGLNKKALFCIDEGIKLNPRLRQFKKEIHEQKRDKNKEYF